ncbi:hypothetical protein SAMN04490240_4098 [Rhodococcus pyridinivorans]|uniref:hypothetical protein n=1 Tax=Rhodococcus pyridinivorans TaxID=103816 RepID=UPI0007CD9613|nr:hypothetical protein [Rhodococcus pyridinivorans]SED52153.1 hypothetical protein SAMN04490240_4098 [Rhodococcus pyridinivorans]
MNPVAIEEAIRDCANRIAKGVTVCSNRYSEFLDADRAYDQAFARAYIEADGAAHERKYIAELATADERANRDLADAAYKYADRTAKALEAELRALQSVGASVRGMYQVAGRGES